MRIIAGDYKGRKLITPTDRKVRPTTDKVKEAIFSMSVHYLEDSIVVDLFSGSGNLGLEALSRGAKHCYFCDISKESLALVRQNIAICKAESKSTVIWGDFNNALRKIKEKADIIILDPPYQSGILAACFDMIGKENLLNPGGIIIAEYGKDIELPDQFGLLSRIKQKKYGTVNISIYELMCADTLD